MPYEEIFRSIAAEYNLDWHLLVEQAYRESRFDPLAVGKANDLGLMQVLPATWDEWAPKVGVYDPFDPASNVRVAGAPLLGGMGIVYLCFDHQEQRPIALKTFRPEFLPDRAGRRTGRHADSALQGRSVNRVGQAQPTRPVG